MISFLDWQKRGNIRRSRAKDSGEDGVFQCLVRSALLALPGLVVRISAGLNSY